MKTLEELKAIRDRMQGQVQFRSDDTTHTRVLVGMATCGIASGARPVLTALSDAVQTNHLNHIAVISTSCIGLCQYEPIVEVIEPGKDKVTYVHVTPEKAVEIVDQHLVNGHIIQEYTISNTLLD